MSDLRSEISQLAHDPALDDLERSLRVTAVIAEALRPLGIEPVIVGGTAVRFWTGAPEFVTHDIDLVMDEPPEADDILVTLGFERQSDGRHWRVPESPVFLELPDRQLEPEGAVPDSIDMGGGRHVRVLSQIDLVVGRALELTIAPHEDVVRQVLALIAGVEDRGALLTRAREVDFGDRVTAIVGNLVRVADRVADGKPLPRWDELYVLVRDS